MVKRADKVEEEIPATEAEARLQQLREEADEIGTVPEYMNAHGIDLTADVHKGGQGGLRLLRRVDVNPDKFKKVKEAAFLDQNLWIEGKGFRERSEVVINFDDLSGKGANLRVSAWTENGDFIRQVPYFATPGKWRVTAYAPVEAVGESAPDDHRRTLEMVDQLTITITR